MSSRPAALVRQNTLPWQCTECGETFQDHVHGRLRDMCVGCTRDFVAGQPGVWLAASAQRTSLFSTALSSDDTAPPRQPFGGDLVCELVDGHVVMGSHVQYGAPRGGGTLLGKFLRRL